MLLSWATAGCLQEAAASWLIQNMDITSAVISLTFIATVQVSIAALPIPNIQAKSPVLQSCAQLRQIHSQKCI